MAGITGMGTTFNLPNFVGDLFSISPQDTPFLSAIGGLTGGRPAVDKEFEWEFYDLRDPDDARQRVEGDDAPTAEARTRSNDKNVVEIHQEAVEISYTRQAVGNRGNYGTAARGTSPVANELAWQVDQQLKQIARDVNLSFITGTYANPANNATPRKTRGLLQAIATNVIDMANATPDIDDILDLFQLAYQNGGLQEGETRTIITTPAIKRHLTKLFVRDVNGNGLVPSRTVGGVNLQTIETDFGTANLMIDRAMPAGQLAVVSLEQCAPRILEIPGKGFLFLEDLAKTGASDKKQLYGEIGLEYGNELAHAKMVDIATPYDNVGAGSGS
jgi:hypothetical protein